MIVFGNPWMLSALIALPVLVVLGMRWDRERRASMACLGDGSAPEGRRRFKRFLVFAALSLVVLVLSQPGIAGADRTRYGGTADVVFVLDVSRSMLTSDVLVNRMERAKDIVAGVVSQLTGQRVGLVTFAGVPAVQCPLTVDYITFDQSLRRAFWDPSERGGTQIGEAVRFAAESGFDDAGGRLKTLVILTDGEEPAAGGNTWAGTLARRGIRIVAVGVGDEAIGGLVPESLGDSTPFRYHGQPVRSRMEPVLLRAMAGATGGMFWNAKSVGPGAILQSIVGSGDEGRGVTQDLRTILLLLAVALLLVEMLIADRRGVLALLLMMSVPGFAGESEEKAARGFEAYRDRHYVAAAANYKDAAQLAPDNPQILFSLACVEYRAQAYSDAYDAFRRAADLTQDKVLKSRALMGAGNSMYRLAAFVAADRLSTALRASLYLYQEALKADPGIPDGAHNVEVVLRRLKEARSHVPNALPGRSREALSDDAREVARQGKAMRPPGRPMAQREAVEKDW